MTSVLIAYATTEGQTRKIAQAMGDDVHRAGHEARLIDLADDPDDIDPANFDVVFVAASLHMGHYQAAARHFVKRHVAALNARQSAFVSVSLSAVAGEYGDEEGAERCAETFLEETGWTPRGVHHAAGALRFTQYNFLKKWIMRRISKAQGYQPSGEDVEFTDWSALRAFVSDCVPAGAAVRA